MLFFRADERNAATIKECLVVYEEASGQLVNFEKSNITFVSNVSEELQ